MTDKLFVVAEVDDSYVYHIHIEIMPRIVYHLDFLLKNPDVKILIGCDSKQTNDLTDFGLRHMMLSIQSVVELVGLSIDRFIVHKNVFAKEVYLPQEGGCQDPIYNTWQILHMRKILLKKLNLDSVILQHSKSSSSMSNMKHKRVLTLLRRSTNSKHTRNNHDSVRQWSDKFTNQMLVELQKSFPQFQIKLFNDKNQTLMSCHACQIEEFYSTDILVGVHGAGLSNMLYLKPNSAVVEIAVYQNDGRCLLGGGPFSRLAAVLSHNYYMHHPPYDEFKWNRDKTSEFNLTRFTDYLTVFLKSIEFI